MMIWGIPLMGAVAFGIIIMLVTTGGLTIAVSGVLAMFQNIPLLYTAIGLVLFYLITRKKKDTSHVNLNQAFKQLEKL
jgi:hypothetical protein